METDVVEGYVCASERGVRTDVVEGYVCASERGVRGGD